MRDAFVITADLPRQPMRQRGAERVRKCRAGHRPRYAEIVPSRLHGDVSTVRLRALVLVILPVPTKLTSPEPVMEPVTRCRT